MRCVSSATPISAAQRKELWGTALHHSFEKKNTSASSDSLYNSCTDLDTEVTKPSCVLRSEEFGRQSTDVMSMRRT
ncbi:hypothetical protein Q1695_008413 [Nippostrongylus brasiliensis]|nr:hypothetical protein Q1695_008413 [Nippostrongylus brasiliensis]